MNQSISLESKNKYFGLFFQKHQPPTNQQQQQPTQQTTANKEQPSNDKQPMRHTTINQPNNIKRQTTHRTTT
jgi:hypothetical protein